MGLAAVITVGSFSGVSVDVHAATVGYEPTITIHPHGVKNRAEFIARFTDIGMMFFSCAEGRDRVYNLGSFFDEYSGRVFTDMNITMEFRYHGSDVVTARAQKVVLVDGVVSQPRRSETVDSSFYPIVDETITILNPLHPNEIRATGVTSSTAIWDEQNRNFWSNVPLEIVYAVQISSVSVGALVNMFPQLSTEDVQTILEFEVIRLVNEIRKEYDLPPLIYHPELAHVARTRTDEVVAYQIRTGNRFAGGHRSPVNGLEHTDFAHYLGLNVRFAGENFFRGAGSPRSAVLGWMDSSGHRDFILSGLRGNSFGSDLVYIGVGVGASPSTFGIGIPWALWQMVE